MSVGEVIKKQRLALGLSQAYLSMLMKVSDQTLAKWENDKTEPKASQVYLLSKYLYVSEKHICSGGVFVDSSDLLRKDLEESILYLEAVKDKFC
jgi:transcriptional regulator with XRE-family HTH domain